ncbi:DUF4179 domain-containing protein [Clostridium tertium]|uniref:DUF4179 domain-containing protein n=1 Tax=Clostridium tertium TaxID=1559 RepID=UPI001AEB5B26|nr:DUF4179 domain-containing protein [Clostridium tertium]MBP1867347.1 hypothetical protein [Clostridium tertium]
MMDLDKELNNLKEKDLKAPPQFENLMKEALNDAKRENKKKLNLNNKYLKIALIFIAFIFIFNLSTVSAMIKKLIGYDDYFSYNSYVKKLNNKGELQEVNESVEFSNGKKVTIEAIVYDNKYLSVFMRGSIAYADRFLPTDEPPEEYDSIKSKSYIRILDGNFASGSSAFSEKDKNGDTLSVWTFKIGESKNEFTLEITEEGEAKEITIDIDSSKIVDIKNIKPDNNEIEIDGVRFVVNNLRISPLAINLDYSVVSDDEEKIKAIQKNDGNFFNEGINFSPNIEGRNIERMGVVAYDEKEILSNGIRIVENFVLKDLAIDKFNKAKIVVERANFSEDLNIDIKSNIKDTWINDNLFIEELKYDESREVVDIAYWSKYKKIWFEKYLPYEIIPYNGIISLEPSSNKSNIKDYLGEDYRKFVFMRRQLYIGDGDNLFDSKKLFVSNNKALNIKKKDRSIKIKINY